MIEVHNLFFSYNQGTQAEIPALKGINASIYNGEFLAVIGHNSCGKSTLAKHLNALLIPQKGEVIVDGNKTTDNDKLWEIRKSCGMVFQNPDNQLVASVVEEEIAFGPENLGIEPEEISKRIDTALASVGIADKKHTPSHLLSGGQKQRLAIAGILAMYPKYLILDEATSMLDPEGRKDVLNVVRQLNREMGLTVIHITHSMEEAAQADRIIVMEQGSIVMIGTPKEIFSRPQELINISLDIPPMTKLALRLKEEGVNIPQDILTVDQMVEQLTEILTRC